MRAAGETISQTQRNMAPEADNVQHRARRRPVPRRQKIGGGAECKDRCFSMASPNA
jgi:hypothetical protein